MKAEDIQKDIETHQRRVEELESQLKALQKQYKPEDFVYKALVYVEYNRYERPKPYVLIQGDKTEGYDYHYVLDPSVSKLALEPRNRYELFAQTAIYHNTKDDKLVAVGIDVFGGIGNLYDDYLEHKGRRLKDGVVNQIAQALADKHNKETK